MSGKTGAVHCAEAKSSLSSPRCDHALSGWGPCASAHHWGRELLALDHKIRLMPPAYVKPYVKRGKTDATDAEAICEAVTRPTMTFVAVKSRQKRGVLMLHNTRDLLVRQRTALIKALRAHLAKFDLVTATGPGGVRALTGLCTSSRTIRHPMRAPLYSRLSSNLKSSLRRSKDLRSKSWLGIAPMTPAADWLLYQASDRSRLPPLQQLSGPRIIPVGSSVRCLAWPDAAPQQLRWKGSTWRHQQTGRRVSPTTASGWSDCDRAEGAR
ncbi:Transposase [Labrenzia sp. THAF82]|nr:Transposase [Labrenzia sp. THAF82]